MQYDNFDNEERPIVVAPPHRELLVEISEAPDACSGAIVVWFAKPRVISSIRRLTDRKRDRLFVTTNDNRLRQFVRRFAEFLSTNNTRSLISMIRFGSSLNVTPEQIITGDYIGNWFQSYNEQLAFPVVNRMQFLARARELGNLIQQFNSYYVVRTQKQLALATTPLPEQTLDQLETFREEYIAFLRDFELWGKEIAAYLQSLGIAEFNAMYQFAPCSNFERVKAFQKKVSG
jgi:hypothetical protein